MNRLFGQSGALTAGIAILLLTASLLTGCGSPSSGARQDPNPPAIDDLRPGSSIEREAVLPTRNQSNTRNARANDTAGQPSQATSQALPSEPAGRGVSGSIIRVSVPIDQSIAQAWRLTESAELPAHSVRDWYDNGFVVAELPLDKLAAFEASLGSIQAISRMKLIGMQRLGTVRVGPEYKKPVPFEFTPPGGSPRRTTLPAGIPQMLVRAEMLDRDRATIEIKPHQFYERLTVTPRAPREKALDGTIFSTLTLLTVAPADRILVIAPTDREAPLIPAEENVEPVAVDDATQEGPVEVSEDLLTPLFENLAATAPPDTQLGHLFLHQRFRGRAVKSIIFVVVDMKRPKVPASIAVAAEPEPQPAAPAEITAETVAVEQSPPRAVTTIEATAAEITSTTATAESVSAEVVNESSQPQPIETGEPVAVETPRPLPAVITIDAEAVATPEPQPRQLPEPVASTSDSSDALPVETRALPEPILVEPVTPQRSTTTVISVEAVEVIAEQPELSPPIKVEPATEQPVTSQPAGPITVEPVRPAPTIIEVQAEAVTQSLPKPAPQPKTSTSVEPVSIEPRTSSRTGDPPPNYNLPNSEDQVLPPSEKPRPQAVHPAPIVIEAEAVEVVDESSSVEEVEPAVEEVDSDEDADESDQ